MSLLMDALKKAEEAKRQAAGAPAEAIEPSIGQDALSLELTPLEPAPASAAPQPGTPLPDLNAHLESLDREFLAHHAQQAAKPASAARPAAAPTTPPQPMPAAAAPASPSQAAAERTAAHNLFDSKQPAPASNKTFLIVVGIVTLLASVGIGVYFWLQLRPANSGLALKVPPMPSVTPGALPPPPPVAVAPTPLPLPPLPAAIPTAAPKAEPTALAGKAKEADEEDEAPVFRPKTARTAPVAPPAESPIRITSSQLRVHPSVARAFEAFSNGNLAQAKSEYQRTLKAEPQNGDALNGLAAVALREGQPGVAEDYYLRALQADPRDSTAMAGLFGLRGQTDPAQSESRLKSVLAGQPESPALLFALGNLQARQGHWNEAQQTYFKAHTLDAANPDILYNLAISLDQLHQPKLAAQYYNQALISTENRPAGFDRERVAARLRQLTPTPAQ